MGLLEETKETIEQLDFVENLITLGRRGGNMTTIGEIHKAHSEEIRRRRKSPMAEAYRAGVKLAAEHPDCSESLLSNMAESARESKRTRARLGI